MYDDLKKFFKNGKEPKKTVNDLMSFLKVERDEATVKAMDWSREKKVFINLARGSIVLKPGVISRFSKKVKDIEPEVVDVPIEKEEQGGENNGGTN